MKKLRIMVISIIVVFSFFLMIYFKERNYTVKYNIKNYKITEKYNKNDKRYYVSIKYKNNEYFYIINNKYTHKRKLVKNIKYYKDDSTTCLTIKFNNKNTNPSCIQDKNYISYNIINDSLKSKIKFKYDKTYNQKNEKDYKNIDIKTLFNKKILIWNYHGFYYLDKDNYRNIKLFKNDIYDAKLIGQINEYLLIPNYDEMYEYSSFKALNVNDLKEKKLTLNDNLSDESYILGINDKSIYYFDTKNKKEYEIVPHKQKYRIVKPKIYNNGKEEAKTELYLSNNKTSFKYDTVYTYKIIDNKLYEYNKYNKHKVLLSNKDVKEIVKESNGDVYYISDDKLYVYSNKYGEVLLLEYFELNFNYKNIIYIFD